MRLLLIEPARGSGGGGAVDMLPQDFTLPEIKLLMTMIQSENCMLAINHGAEKVGRSKPYSYSHDEV